MKTIGYFDSYSFLDAFRGKEFQGKWPNVREMFHITVLRYPENACFHAFSPVEERFTYTEAEKKIEAVARFLASKGVGKGDKIAVSGKNSPEWAIAYFGIIYAGATVVPLDYLLKDNEMETLISFGGVTKLFIDTERIDAIDKDGRLGLEKFALEKGSSYPFVLEMDGPEAEYERAEGGDVAAILFTSGTTGTPKGVMLTHHNITNNGFFTGEGMRFTSSDKLCCCVPLFHCFGVVLASMNVLTHGSTQVMVEKFDPLLVLASVHKERCTALYGVPTMFIAELNHPMFDMFDLSSLRTGIMAGSLCPVELMRAVTEKMHITHITSVYGLTESSPGMTHTVLEDSFENRCNTVGKEYPFTEVKVVDPDTGEECQVGQQGELCCRGYLVMKGYYKNPEATKEVIDKDGFLHSGDLGVKDENGYYRITGRIKDMIIRGGENIYPRELEEFLYHLPGVKDVQVAAVPSKKYGEEVGAFIIKKENSGSLTEDIVKDFCRGKIARHKIPKYVFFVDEFPMTGSGKIQKFKLKELSLKLLAEQGIIPV